MAALADVAWLREHFARMNPWGLNTMYGERFDRIEEALKAATNG